MSADCAEMKKQMPCPLWGTASFVKQNKQSSEARALAFFPLRPLPFSLLVPAGRFAKRQLLWRVGGKGGDESRASRRGGYHALVCISDTTDVTLLVGVVL